MDGGPKQTGKFFTFFVDDVEHRIDHSPATGAELMDIAGVPHDVGLVLLLEDGTQETIKPTDTIELEPGRRLKKAPRFKRG